MKKVSIILIMSISFLSSCKKENEVSIPNINHTKMLGLRNNVKNIEVNYFLNEITKNGYIPKQRSKIIYSIDFAFNQFKSDYSVYKQHYESFDPFTTPLYFLCEDYDFLKTYSYNISFNTKGNVTKWREFGKDSLVRAVNITYNDKQLPIKISTKKLYGDISGNIPLSGGEPTITIENAKYNEDEFNYTYNKYGLIKTITARISNGNKIKNEKVNYRYDFKQKEKVIYVYKNTDKISFATIDIDNNNYISKITIKGNNDLLDKKQNEKDKTDVIQTFTQGTLTKLQEYNKQGQLLKQNAVRYSGNFVTNVYEVKWIKDPWLTRDKLEPFTTEYSLNYFSNTIQGIKYKGKDNSFTYFNPQATGLSNWYNEIKSSTHFSNQIDKYNNWTELKYEVDRKYLDDFINKQRDYLTSVCKGDDLYNLKLYPKTDKLFPFLRMFKSESNQIRIVRDIRYYN